MRFNDEQNTCKDPTEKQMRKVQPLGDYKNCIPKSRATGRCGSGRCLIHFPEIYNN